MGCSTQRPAFSKAAPELSQPSRLIQSRVRPQNTTMQRVDYASESSAIMAMEIGSDDDSEGDTDGDAEEEQS